MIAVPLPNRTSLGGGGGGTNILIGNYYHDTSVPALMCCGLSCVGFRRADGEVLFN